MPTQTTTQDPLEGLDSLEQQFVQWIERSVGMDEALDENRQRINEYRYEYHEALEAMGAARRRLRDAEEVHAQLLRKQARGKRRLRSRIPKFQRMLRTIREHPLIADVRFEPEGAVTGRDEEVLSVITKRIEIEVPHDGTIRDLGDFHIVFGRASTLRVLPGPERRAGARATERPHPHVDGNGHACLGNIVDSVFRWLDEGEYDTVVVAMIEYLQSYNLEDETGWYIFDYPLASHSPQPTYTTLAEIAEAHGFHDHAEFPHERACSPTDCLEAREALHEEDMHDYCLAHECPRAASEACEAGTHGEWCSEWRDALSCAHLAEMEHLRGNHYACVEHFDGAFCETVAVRLHAEGDHSSCNEWGGLRALHSDEG